MKVKPLSNKEVQSIEAEYEKNPCTLRPEFDVTMRAWIRKQLVYYRLYLAIKDQD